MDWIDYGSNITEYSLVAKVGHRCGNLRERYFETIGLVAGNVAMGRDVNLANIDKRQVRLVALPAIFPSCIVFVIWG